MSLFKELKLTTFLFVELFFCYHSSANKSDEYQLKNKVGEGDVLNSYGVTLKANMF